jgi:acylphosphatase
MRRVRVFVEGRVQGVFFRESTRRRAIELGVHGWVRNLHDGRVEAVFEGPAQAVDEAVAFLRHGPPYARVDAITVEDEPVHGEFDDFRITR